MHLRTCGTDYDVWIEIPQPVNNSRLSTAWRTTHHEHHTRLTDVQNGVLIKEKRVQFVDSRFSCT